MNVNVKKTTCSCEKCAECGKTAKEANLHALEFGKLREKSFFSFFLCYSCLKNLETEIKCVRPEGMSVWEICENGMQEPEDAKDCLHCRECIVCTPDGFGYCFECLQKGFTFEEDEVPKEKRCQKD